MRKHSAWTHPESFYTRNQNVISGSLQTISDAASTFTCITDGSRVPLSTKEIGSIEIFATSLMHSPNGRFVTVVGDGEYITYTALSWRNKSFGNGISFAWHLTRTLTRCWRASLSS